MKDSLAGAAAVQLRARRPGRPDAFAFVRAADPNGRRFHPSACRVVCSSRPCFTPSIPRRRSFAVLNPHCRCPRNPSDSPFHPPPLPLLLPPPLPHPIPVGPRSWPWQHCCSRPLAVHSPPDVCATSSCLSQHRACCFVPSPVGPSSSSSSTTRCFPMSFGTK